MESEDSLYLDDALLIFTEAVLSDFLEKFENETISSHLLENLKQ
jgi:hypothetical protein